MNTIKDYSTMISDRFEDFSQAIRMFSEAKIEFYELFLVDPNDAVSNIELTVKSMLDAFSSLYDATRTQPGVNFNFYGNPLCCAVLAYRNAKHHNTANGIRSLYKHSRENGRRNYLLVNFPAGETEEGGSFTEHYASWSDFSFLLGMPNNSSRLREGSRELIRDRISADTFESFAADQGHQHEHIFINMIPIIIGSGSEFIAKLKPYIHLNSVDARYFLSHFETTAQANFSAPEYCEFPSSVFG